VSEEIVRSTADIVVTAEGPIRIVTLNRPDARNAFSEPMHREFARAMAAIDDDAGVRAVVLTGAGRAFSAGGSFDDFEAKRLNFDVRRQSMRDARRLVDEMLNLHVPVVAAVNGPAVGLGCTLVTLCDIVFIAKTAFLADPHVAVALVAGDGGAVTWPFLTSLLHAKRYLLTGDRMPADEALGLGLANFVVEPDELLPAATAFARRLADLPPQAVQDTKAVLNQHLRQSALSVLAYGLAAESQSHDTEAYREVIKRNTTP
jgi:enoyl-CoA hydratase/carnithine racemase